MPLPLTLKERTSLESALAALDDDDGHNRMMAADLFALGCLLIVEGKSSAGRKACLTALRALRVPADVRTSLVEKVITTPDQAFDLLAPHTEILALLPGRHAAATS